MPALRRAALVVVSLHSSSTVHETACEATEKFTALPVFLLYPLSFPPHSPAGRQGQAWAGCAMCFSGHTLAQVDWEDEIQREAEDETTRSKLPFPDL